jgi:hypothetical protein
MKTNKLYAGQSFKNYKELCKELDMEVKKSADTKNAQFKELMRYCKYNKVGHKFYIEEVYETPLPKVENRGKSAGSRGNNNVYGKLIQLLLLDILAQCKDGAISISRGKLLLTLNMINNNYRMGGENTKKLSAFTEIEESIIFDFYNTSNSNFKSAVESALNSLMDKRIIWYETVTKVSEGRTHIHRTATDSEKEIILKCEKEVLSELGYKQLSTVRVSKDWKKFKSKVKKRLNEESNINYYYFAYMIIAYDKFVEEEKQEIIQFLLDHDKREEFKDELNSTVYLNLIDNAKKRHEKAFSSRKMGKYRLPESYIEDMTRLVNLLIDKNTSDLVEDILKAKEDIISDDQLETLEQLFG